MTYLQIKPGHAVTNDLDEVAQNSYRARISHSNQMKYNLNGFSFLLNLLFIKNQDRTYTVMMIDPDYPHHAAGQFYLHWLITNIPVSIFGFSFNFKKRSFVCYISFDFIIHRVNGYGKESLMTLANILLVC